MVETHQPGEAAFRAILPEDIDWKPFPAFPPSVRLAIVVGHPSEPGPYVIRVKAPSGMKLMPHRHPEDRIDTVISGVFYIGLGERFDGDKVKAYPPGSVIVLPGNTWHFHWAKSGEYVTQVNAIGPLGLEYLDPGDDPREQAVVERREVRLRHGALRLVAGLLPGVGGFSDARIVSIAGPGPREGTLHGTSDFLSHDRDRWALHLLPRGRRKRRADASPAAWISLFIADVRASLCPALRPLSPGCARLPGLRTQRLAGPENIRVHVRPLGRDHESLRRSARAHAYTLYMQDYGGPVGFRMALAHPDRIEALIVQDAVAHNEGLGAIWKPRRAFWADRAANESALRANFLSLATTRTRHIGSDPNADRYDLDLWTDEFAFLTKPGQADIQSDLFYDYRTNVDAYPKWQAWLRATQPRLLVLWGKYDPSFDISEPEAYRRDVPKAEVHVLDAGHFALDTAADQIAELIRNFMK